MEMTQIAIVYQSSLVAGKAGQGSKQHYYSYTTQRLAAAATPC